MKRAPKLTDTIPLDGTPVFRGLSRMLRDARAHGWSGKLVSADRRKGVAERYGKKSQWWLYMSYWVWKLKGANPANRPGRSTHELRSDAVAYPGPVGRPLAWWQLGMDVTEPHELVVVLQRLGYAAFRPYSSPSEAHHVNLKSSPTRTLRKRGLAWKPAVRKPKVQRLSDKGLDLIAGFEGWRAQPYNDAAGHATIGFGHLLHHGPVTTADRKRWGTITRKRGLELLREDARNAEAAVRDLVKVPLSQSEFDALVSFVFNVGGGAFRNSTLLKRLNEGNRRAAADQFLVWTHAGGKVLPGLVRRRKAERALFLS